MEIVSSSSLMEGFAMHIQQATYTFDTPETAQEAISGIWERGGYVRPTPGKPNSVDVVADTDAFIAIRSFAMPTAGAPGTTAAEVAERQAAEQAAQAGNAVVPPVEGEQVIQ